MTKILFHSAPSTYHYKFERDFKQNFVAIWLYHNCRYDYNLGKETKSIWGFYNTKTKEFYSPKNSKTIGRIVNINKTTPYTAMQLCQSPSWHTH